MGVRSMCCFIHCRPALLVDPGVSLAPHRFGLPPHHVELDQLMKKRQLIQDYAKKADIVTISHWHNDHYTPFITGLYGSVTPDLAKSVYRGKMVLAKSMKGLNFMQKKRAQSFLRECTCEPCDGKMFSFDEVVLRFSHPVPHGTCKKIPVVMLSIEGERKIVHASDTQGFSGLQFIKEEAPDVLVMSGPPAHLLTPEDVRKAESNLLDILDFCGELILDHHHVRDLTFKEAFPEIWENPKVKTAAEYAGSSTLLLEAHRRELYLGAQD